MGSTENHSIMWKGDPVQCYNKALKKGDYVFYKSFVLNGETYFAGDFVLCKNSIGGRSKTRICRLMTLYHSNEPWHANSREKAIVRWYTWAKDLENRCNPQRIRFDVNNEVIEDYRGIDVIVSLEIIIKKCLMIFGTEEDPIDLIRRKKLNPGVYFCCRYKIISDEIEPIFSPNSEWGGELYTTLSIQNSPITNISDLKSPLKRKTPSSKDDEHVGKSARLTAELDRLNISTPHQKKSVKRNLNDSFADLPDLQSNTPLLNYSIISPPSPSKDVVKIKLRVSQNQNPKVVLEKVDDKFIKSLCSPNKTESADENRSTLRRSTRSVGRKSYVECITPEKFTPKKRGRAQSVASEIEMKLGSSDRRKRNVLRTEMSPESVLAEINRTPTKMMSVGRRNTRTPRVCTETPSRRKSVLKITDDCSTPSKRVTLNEDFMQETPKRSKSLSTPKSILKSTPGLRLKQIKEGIITPSIQKREKFVEKGNTPLIKARSQLHVSHVPEALPCREKEYCDILGFLEGKLQDGCGGCMYISGVPGTGKTATVTAVIRNLQEMSDVEFEYVSLNGMRLTEPRQAYVEILRQLTGKTVLWEQAQTMLDNRFSKSKKVSKPVVMLVDELDILCTKRQDVVYNLLDWPTKANTQLIVVTIANTMDLPERLLMGRVTSRLGLTRLTFQPYSYKQLQEIVLKRLEGLNTFNPDAIQLVARKVASVSGDARRALDICRRAAEFAEAEGAYTLVSMIHVNNALNAMITQPKVQAIKHCSRLEQLILQAVVAEVERTGVEETTFADVYTMLTSLAALDGFMLVSRTRVLGVVNRLGACRLVLTDQKSSDIYQRIILNVSPDDVYYALRKD